MSSKSKTKTNAKGLQLYRERPWELFKTVALIFTWVVLGIHLELVGPTLLTLADQVHVDQSGISTILVSRSGGYLAINVFGAMFSNRVNKYSEFFLSSSFLLASIVVFFTPMIRGLVVLSILFFLQGISQGGTDLAGTSLMLSMWGDEVSAPLNAVHLGFGFGAVAANFLVMPFIVQGDESSTIRTTTTTTMSMLTNPSKSDSLSIVEDRRRFNLVPPYRVSALICLLISVGHLLIFLRQRTLNRRRQEENERESHDYQRVNKKDDQSVLVVKEESYSPYSPRSFGRGSFSYGLLLSSLWWFYMFFLSGNDQTFSKFFFSYLSSKEFHLSSFEATWGMIVYWFSYSIGRLICAVVTIFCPVHYALNGLWVLGLLVASTWLLFVRVFGLSSKALFILGGLTGLVFSPTFPLSFGFINQRLDVNPFLLGFILCAGSLGAMIFQKLGGIILDWNYQYFPILLVICVLLAIFFYIAASIVCSIHQRKLDENNKINNRTISKASEEEIQMQDYLNNE